MLAERWALRDGLFLAIQLGIQNLEVELDAKVIVDLINSNSQSVYYSSGGLQVAARDGHTHWVMDIQPYPI